MSGPYPTHPHVLYLIEAQEAEKRRDGALQNPARTEGREGDEIIGVPQGERRPRHENYQQRL